MPTITTLEELATIYGIPNDASTVNDVDRVTLHDRAFIDAVVKA